MKERKGRGNENENGEKGNRDGNREGKCRWVLKREIRDKDLGIAKCDKLDLTSQSE